MLTTIERPTTLSSAYAQGFRNQLESAVSSFRASLSKDRVLRFAMLEEAQHKEDIQHRRYRLNCDGGVARLCEADCPSESGQEAYQVPTNPSAVLVHGARIPGLPICTLEEPGSLWQRLVGNIARQLLFSSETMWKMLIDEQQRRSYSTDDLLDLLEMALPWNKHGRYVILDGLYECTRQSKLSHSSLSRLRRLEQSPVCVLVTSRPLVLDGLLSTQQPDIKNITPSDCPEIKIVVYEELCRRVLAGDPSVSEDTTASIISRRCSMRER